MDGLELDFVVPPPDLRPFVGLFYRFRAPGPYFDDVERAGHAQLRFRLAGTGAYQFADGTRQDAPPFHVVGPTTGPTRLIATGSLWAFGLGLTPAGWAALIGTDASAMANRCIDATELFGDAVAETAIPLRACPCAASMVEAAAPLLRRLFGQGHGGTLDFVRAVDAWLAGSPSPALTVLEAATGLSRRQVERRCNALYGAPPKLLARKYRALRAAVAMASGEEPAADGFYDQSHMIREVKQFTGLTPRRMRDEPGVLAQLTIARRRALDGQVHPIISRS